MEISEIISISGQGGLFKVVARSKNGLIAESLKECKRIPVYASQKISALEDISIFGQNEDLPLVEIFKKIFEKENGGVAIDPKSDNDALKKYFETIYPEYDESRVYVSDMKKVFTWYNILHEMGMLKMEEVKEETSTEEATADDKIKKVKATTKSASAKISKGKETSAPKASSKSKGAKTATIRKTGA